MAESGRTRLVAVASRVVLIVSAPFVLFATLFGFIGVLYVTVPLGVAALVGLVSKGHRQAGRLAFIALVWVSSWSGAFFWVFGVGLAAADSETQVQPIEFLPAVLLFAVGPLLGIVAGRWLEDRRSLGGVGSRDTRER